MVFEGHVYFASLQNIAGVNGDHVWTGCVWCDSVKTACRGFRRLGLQQMSSMEAFYPYFYQLFRNNIFLQYSSSVLQTSKINMTLENHDGE